MPRPYLNLLVSCLSIGLCGMVTLTAQAQQQQPTNIAKQPIKSIVPKLITLKWTQAADMPVAVFQAAGSLVDHRHYVVTGGLWQSGLANDSVQVFDVPNNKWSLPCKLNTARFNHTQVTLDGHALLVLGGQETRQVGKGTAILSPELINIADGTTTQLPDPPDGKPTRGPVACLMSNKAVIVGGDRLYRFDIKTRAWAPTLKLKSPRDYSAIVPLDERRLLIIAGAGSDSLETIDVVSGESRQLDVKLPMKLDDTKAFRLDDGRVWIIAGQDGKTGDTTDRTWFLSLADKADSASRDTLTDGPALRVKDGVSDHQLILSPPYLFVLGGESQKSGVDRELNIVRGLNLRTTQVHAATPLPRACDDALAFEHAGRLYIVGGFYVGPPMLGNRRLPFASREVYTAEAPAE